MADGPARPTRQIKGQASRLGRTIHAIEYDPVHDEIVVPQPLPQAILTFRGSANGEEPPVRVIQGSKTRLNFPDRLALDPVNGEIFIVEARDSNHPSILVFPREAQGDVAPIRLLGGPDTGIGGGTASVAVDATTNSLVYAGTGALLVFNRTDAGNVKPRRVISGPATMISSGIQNVRVLGRWILLAIGGGGGRPSFVGVWSIDDNGDVPPRWTIGGPNGDLDRARGVAVDIVNQTVIVTDKGKNAISTYAMPQLFAEPAKTAENRPGSSAVR